LTAVNRYATIPWSKFTSITSFFRMLQTHPKWAYQALSNLVERYGCVAAIRMEPSVASAR